MRSNMNAPALGVSFMIVPTSEITYHIWCTICTPTPMILHLFCIDMKASEQKRVSIVSVSLGSALKQAGPLRQQTRRQPPLPLVPKGDHTSRWSSQQGSSITRKSNNIEEAMQPFNIALYDVRAVILDHQSNFKEIRNAPMWLQNENIICDENPQHTQIAAYDKFEATQKWQ